MHRHIFVILAVCLFSIPTFVACADVIVEPDNGFYSRHRSQIIYLGRSFTAHGEGGCVSVKKEPGVKNDTATLQNGAVTYVQYSCLYGGDYWGFTFEYSGWVKLDQMLVLYDYVAFAEDNPGKFYSYNGDYMEIKKLRAAIAWPWPGADAPLWIIEDLDTEYFRVLYAYTDCDNREWGFATYMYDSSNIWICLSDPLNRDIPIFNPAPEPATWASETVHVDIKQFTAEREFPTLVIIIVLVAILVAVTVTLIKVFWNPNKTKAEGRNND